MTSLDKLIEDIHAAREPVVSDHGYYTSTAALTWGEHKVLVLVERLAVIVRASLAEYDEAPK